MLSAFTTSISPTPVRSSSPVLSHESPVAVVRALNSSLSSVEGQCSLLVLVLRVFYCLFRNQTLFMLVLRWSVIVVSSVFVFIA
ncbi:hypothetical protein S245_020668 [Arachis hypogaea]